MTLDCNQYRVNVGPIQALLHGKTEEERYKLISTIALVTGVPVIVVTCYVIELYGLTGQLTALLDLLMKFYRVDDVLNLQNTGATR